MKAPIPFRTEYQPWMLPTDLAVHVPCSVYARHHAECPTCSEHHWFYPGAPKRLGESPNGQPEAFAVSIGGRKVYYLNEPDLEVLCPIGRRLFRDWEKAVYRLVEWKKGRGNGESAG